MNNLHKLFLELKKLDYDDFDLLCDAYRENHYVKQNCKAMGIKYQDKYLINAITKRVSTKCGTISPTGTVPPNQISSRDKKIEKIILGDNLDIIEEAAKKKGLI